MSARAEYISVAGTGNSEQEVIETTAYVIDEYNITADETGAAYYPVIQRDPNDIRMNFRLVFVMGLLLVSNLVLASLLVYKSTKGPAMVVVERTEEGDRVIGSDKAYALEGSVQVRPDTPGKGDKLHLARRWCESFYQIDPNPQIRTGDIKRGLGMMTYPAANSLVQQVTKSGEWEKQRREEWKAVWTPQVVEISKDDPYKVQIVGVQEITKKVGNTLVQQKRQLMFTLELLPDSAKRTDLNQNTGFQVNGQDQFKELVPAESSSSSSSSSVNQPVEPTTQPK